jgi:hypothetical protein
MVARNLAASVSFGRTFRFFAFSGQLHGCWAGELEFRERAAVTAESTTREAASKRRLKAHLQMSSGQALASPAEGSNLPHEDSDFNLEFSPGASEGTRPAIPLDY